MIRRFLLALVLLSSCASDPPLANRNIDSSLLLYKFGYASDIDMADDFVTIWDGAGNANANKVYDWAASAETLYISSSSASDTEPIKVMGLNASWLEQEQTTTLVGQTKTEIGSGLTWIRSNRAKNMGDEALVGTVYIYADGDVTGGVPDDPDTIRAIITIGQEQTLMALWSVPANKTAYMVSWYADVSKLTSGVSLARLTVREFGGVFRVQELRSLQVQGSSGNNRRYIYTRKFGAKTDIAIDADASSNDMGVSGGFDLVYW